MSENAKNSTSQVVVCSNCQTKNRVPVVAHGIPRCGKCHTPLPWVVNATDTDFASVAEAATIPVLVDVWAPWCAPCRMVSPALEQLAGELAGRLKLVKVNADDSPAVSNRRSEEHTSELQSQSNLVCRLLLEKKKNNLPANPCDRIQARKI